MGVCNCPMFCCAMLCVRSSIAIILMGKRELVALLNLSSWCLVMVERLFLAVPQGCLQFVIVLFPDHTHLLFLGGIFIFIQILTDIYINEQWRIRSEPRFDLVLYSLPMSHQSMEKDSTLTCVDS